jgi:hypothetical protein
MFVALGVGFAAASGCQGPTPQPAELGNCTPIKDASCSSGNVGGGGSGGSADGGDSGDDSGSSGGADASCGAAGQALNTSNPNCATCIAASCCTSDTLCSANSAALAIVTCVETNCSPQQQQPDPVCVGNCENAQQTGVNDYNDFGSCLAANCPACPALPQGTPTGDL